METPPHTGASPAGAPPPPRRILPPPPVVHETENWRGKYKGGNETGRELLCVMVGDQWHRMLIAMETQIAEAGLTPIVAVSNQETRDMLILAVDDLVPSWVKATPPIVAAFKTSLLMTQRLAKAKAIKDAKERANRSMRVVTQPPPVQTPPPAPPPAPTREEAYDHVDISTTGRIRAPATDLTPRRTIY